MKLREKVTAREKVTWIEKIIGRKIIGRNNVKYIDKFTGRKKVMDRKKIQTERVIKRITNR